MVQPNQMPPRSAQKNRRSKKVVADRQRSNTTHYNAILLEDVRHKLEMVIEATQTTRVELNQEIKETQETLSGRLDIIAAVIRDNSATINKLSDGMRNMERQMSDKTDPLSARLEDHEGRIARLEEGQVA